MREHERNEVSGVHTDPAALDDLTSAAEKESTGITAAGGGEGYDPRRTLRFGVEMRRQLSRRRTQLLLGLVALLPIVLVVAFEIGTANANARQGGFIDLATVSAPNFVVVNLIVAGGFLLPLIVALYFGDMIASEASWSSLKYLLAIPVPRQRLLRQKALVAAALSVMTITVLPLMALIVGVIFYGAGDAIAPTGEAAPFWAAVVSLVMSIGYIVVHLVWIGGLALLLSVSTDAPLGAVGGALVASIVSLMLDQITALEDLRNFLPTHYAYAWTDLMAAEINWTNIANGALSAVCYGTVFCLLAGRHFARKDITS